MMKVSFFVVCAHFLVLASGHDIWKDFQKFVFKFQKKYNSLEEFVERFKIFKDNLHYVNDVNQAKLNYTLEIIHFG